MNAALSIIIVSYNTREMTLRCLRHLRETLAERPDFGGAVETIVVDNASTDGTVRAIKEFDPSVVIIANTENVGFGAANNAGMRVAGGELLLLLNSDAFPEAGAIPILLDFLRKYPKVGIVGPRLLNEDGSLQLSCFRFPSPMRAWAENLWLSALWPNSRWLGDYRHWSHDTRRNVDFIVGACLLVRRTVFEEVGGFDRRFFMYAEETDWQKRIAAAGWTITFLPEAMVVHIGGASGINQKNQVRNSFFESLDQYALKHHGFPGLVLLRMAMAIGCTLRLGLWSVAWLFQPRRRDHAIRKMRLHAWLVRRQVMHWPARRWLSPIPTHP
jgi:GT2 family glycosyltransferase